MSLDGKIAIVTGGSSGIGYAITKRLSAEGALVIIASRNEPKTKFTNGIFIKTDISSENSVKKLVETVIEKYGNPDIVINNAVVSFDHTNIEFVDEEDFNQIMDINFKG